MNLPNLEDILYAMETRGYQVWDDPRGYDLNLVGIRTADMGAETFNDWFTCFYRQGESWVYMAFPCTTDPGLYWRNNPMNVKGTAILQPGQHRGMWQLGQHRGSYPALVQKNKVPVYRDANRDDYLDTEGQPVDVGYHGINLHRASAHVLRGTVGQYSAGCQVLQDAKHLDIIVDLAREAAHIYGNSFSYVLLTGADDF